MTHAQVIEIAERFYAAHPEADAKHKRESIRKTCKAMMLSEISAILAHRFIITLIKNYEDQR